MTIVCRNCGKELPAECFEAYATGTRRRVCRHCHYLLHVKPAKRRWLMREKVRMLLLE